MYEVMSNEYEEKIKVMTVFGTRPEAIKMAPVVLELEKYPDLITPIVAVTAQHRDMLDQVLHLFKIKPDYDLNIMAQGQTLFDITTKAMNGLNEVLSKENRILSWCMAIRRRLLPAHWQAIIMKSRWAMWKQVSERSINIRRFRKK